jgi:peptidoglycan/xylan/chitin deacetylase (PgdA/CDA1 family)
MKAWMKPARQLALVASAVAAAAMMAGPPLTLAGPALTAGTHAQRVPQGLGGKVWSIIPTHAKVVGLTFDVGSNADGVASILHTLSTQRVAASFFVTGNFVNAYAAQAKRWRPRGGSATIPFSHPDFVTENPPLTDTQIRQQVLGAQQMIKTVTGADPARPPAAH